MTLALVILLHEILGPRAVLNLPLLLLTELAFFGKFTLLHLSFQSAQFKGLRL